MRRVLSAAFAIVILATAAWAQTQRDELAVAPCELVVLTVPGARAEGKPSASVVWSVLPADKKFETFELAAGDKLAIASGPSGATLTVEALRIDWEARKFSKQTWVIKSIGQSPTPTPPPTPPPAPIDIPNAQGYGQISYTTAMLVDDLERPKTAAMLAAKYRSAAKLVTSQGQLITTIWNECLAASPSNWETWRMAIRAVPQKTRSTSEWAQVFGEIATSLEAVR